MSDHADVIREGLDLAAGYTALDDEHSEMVFAALAALDRLVAERDEARARNVALETQQITDALGLRDTALEAAEAEVTRLREALEAIVNPRVGPTGGLSRSHGGTGFPVEIARAALADKEGT